MKPLRFCAARHKILNESCRTVQMLRASKDFLPCSCRAAQTPQ
ncbi:unnamed protein product [Rhodiola kirilowii]